MGSISPPPGQRPAAIPGPAQPFAQEPPPARGGCLTIYLGLNILFCASLVVVWLATPDELLRLLPRASRSVLDGTILLTAAQGFFALALWRWKKWGFYGLAATNVLVILATLAGGGQPSSAGGLVGLGILWWLLQDHWEKMPYASEPSRSGRAISLAIGAVLLLMIVARFFRSGAVAGGFDSGRDPAADVRMALDRGSAEHRRVLVLVGGNWSPASVAADQQLGSGAAGKLVDKEFVLVRVSVSPALENVERLKQYPKLQSVPHLYVLTRGGDCAASLPADRLPADDAKLVELLGKWRL